MKTPQQIVDAWNEKHPVGTLVKYSIPLNISHGYGTLIAKTCHQASLTMSGTPVLWLDGYRGCVALSHCEPVGGDQ